MLQRRPTLTSILEGDFQLFYEGKRIDFDDSIGAALRVTSLESRINHTVELRETRKVFVMDINGVREMCVFDSTTVAELGLNCSSSVMMGSISWCW